MSTKQPLAETKSTGAVEYRTKRGRQQHPSKTVSAHELQVPGIRQMLREEDDIIKRRTHSAPLTLEATLVAKELKRLSDTLQSGYENGKIKTKRRHTIGGSTPRGKFPKPSSRSNSGNEASFEESSQEDIGVEKGTEV